MVKFSLLALASALATTANAAGVRRKNTIKLGNGNNRALRRGDPSTEALLKKARPYKQQGASAARRHLDENEVAFDGSYSLKFSQCVDVKTANEDLFDEDIVQYAQEGQVVSSSSYVLFHVCQGETCDYDAENDIYMVDLATYLTNIAMYHSNKRADYCEACNEFEETCNPEQDENEEAEADEEEEANEQGDEDEEEGEDEANDEQEEEGDEEEGEEGEEEGEEDNEEDEGEDRKLVSRKLDKQYIDCDQCNAYECFVDDEDLDENMQTQDDLDEKVSEWIQELVECKESGQQWNGLDIYLGAMCSPYGDGIELAVFLDDECTLYTNQMQFADVYNPYNDNEDGDGTNYLNYAEEFIKAAFSEVTPCLQQEFADPNEEEDENEQEEEEYEMNDYCGGVLEEEIADINNCQADGDNNNQDNNNNNQNNYNWYTYDLEEADDVNEVCNVINKMEGEYSYHYDEEASGTWYKRNKKGQIISTDEPVGVAVFGYDTGMSGGVIAAIVAGTLLGIGAIALLLKATLCKKKEKYDPSSGPVYQGGSMM